MLIFSIKICYFSRLPWMLPNKRVVFIFSFNFSKCRNIIKSYISITSTLNQENPSHQYVLNKKKYSYLLKYICIYIYIYIFFFFQEKNKKSQQNYKIIIQIGRENIKLDFICILVGFLMIKLLKNQRRYIWSYAWCFFFEYFLSRYMWIFKKKEREMATFTG